MIIMDIEKLKSNLKNTIYGKELYLDALKKELEKYEPSDIKHMTTVTVAEMLELNIIELNNILVDVEQCSDVQSYTNVI